MTTPFVMAPTAIVFDTSLPPLARLLWQALEHHSGPNRTCWPGYATLAKEVGCSARWIPVLLQRLVAAGLLTIHTRLGKTNLYTLQSRVERQPQNKRVTTTQEVSARPPMKPNTYNQKPAPKTKEDRAYRRFNQNRNGSEGIDFNKYAWLNSAT